MFLCSGVVMLTVSVVLCEVASSNCICYDCVYTNVKRSVMLVGGARCNFYTYMLALM